MQFISLKSLYLRVSRNVISRACVFEIMAMTTIIRVVQIIDERPTRL